MGTILLPTHVQLMILRFFLQETEFYVCHHPLCNLALSLDNISCLSLIQHYYFNFNLGLQLPSIVG